MKTVAAYLLHVIPVGNDAVLNRVLEGQNTTLGLSLISNVAVLLAHANHHTLMTRTSNNGREHSARSVVSRKTGLHHTGAVINNKSSYFVVPEQSMGVLVPEGHSSMNHALTLQRI